MLRVDFAKRSYFFCRRARYGERKAAFRQLFLGFGVFKAFYILQLEFSLQLEFDAGQNMLLRIVDDFEGLLFVLPGDDLVVAVLDRVL